MSIEDFIILWVIKQKIQASFAKQNGALSDKLHIADGLPMPICHFISTLVVGKRQRGD